MCCDELAREVFGQVGLGGSKKPCIVAIAGDLCRHMPTTSLRPKSIYAFFPRGFTVGSLFSVLLSHAPLAAHFLSGVVRTQKILSILTRTEGQTVEVNLVKPLIPCETHQERKNSFHNSYEDAYFPVLKEAVNDRNTKSWLREPLCSEAAHKSGENIVSKRQSKRAVRPNSLPYTKKIHYP